MNGGMIKLYNLLALILLLSLSSCIKQFPENELVDGEKKSITFTVAAIDNFSANPLSSTRGLVPINQVASKLSFILFDRDVKIQKVDQESSDPDFGTLTMDVPKGNYSLVVIAHSGENNPSVSGPQKISFRNDSMSDTFCCFKTFTVDNDSETSVDLTMSRAVALFRLVMKDKIPDSVKFLDMKSYGGSLSLNPMTMFGVTNSNQLISYEITSNDRKESGESVFKLYSFPHEEYDTLRVTVNAVDGNDNVLASRVFTKVPIRRGYITTYSGDFFGKNSDLTILVDTTWNHMNFTY